MDVWERPGLREIMLGLALLGLALELGACGPDASEDQGNTASLQHSVVPDSMTIPRMLETDDRFSTLRAAIDSTGLDSLLATDGPFTLFAPPNKAFDALPPGAIDALLSEQPDRLRTILRHHVVEGRILTEEWSTSRTVITLSGDTLSLRRTQDGFMVGTTSVVDGDIEAANGLLHVVDRVLPPPSATRERTALGATKDLPDFYWIGDTDMRCLQECVGQAVEHGYTHHIPRLMVIGLFGLLYGIDPQQMNAWPEAMYVDAWSGSLE